MGKISDIPKEMRERPQWVLHREKVPHQPNGRKASSTDSQTWSTSSNVLESARTGQFDGIGFVLSSGDPYVGFDLDDCISGGAIEPWAVEIVEKVASYTEVSPSGTGLHIIAKGKLPVGGCKTSMPGGGELEMYARERYLTVTGDVLDNNHGGIEERGDQIKAVYREHFGSGAASGHAPSMNGKAGPGNDASASVLVEKAKQAKNGDAFAALWSGDTSAHDGDHSRADAALCSHLAFWTGGDAGQMDELFREGGLMRSKWDEERGAHTYGERTIRKALEGQSDFYPPRANGHGNDANDANDAGNEKQKQRSLATKAVDLVTERADLYHSGRTMQLARRKADGQNLLLDSDAFQYWVSDLYMEKHDKALPSSSFKDALSVLKGKATKTDHTAHVRTCGDLAEQVVYLNLGEGRIAEVTPERVEIKSATESPVRFWEPQAAKPLPEPDLSGTLDDVGEALSLDGDALLVAVGWLLAAFLPVGELPVLAVRGRRDQVRAHDVGNSPGSSTRLQYCCAPRRKT